MVVVVTGGFGFLGSHLVESLLEDGETVYVVDNSMTGRIENIPARWHGSTQLRIVATDVRKFEWREEYGHLDRIFHLACPASPPQYQGDELDTLSINFDGTRRMLEIAREQKARLLLTSTSEVYGDPEEHPQTEEYRGSVSIRGPRACYDVGKRAAETMVSIFSRQFGVETRTVRIFNTYGPRLNPKDGRVVSNFVRQALSGEPLTIYGTGEQTRSFCFVSDLIRGLRTVMEADYSDPINLGNPTERTMLELAELVISLTDSSSTIEFHELPKDDPTQRRPDITLAHRVLGWEPTIPLEDGLKTMIDSFRRSS